MAVPSSELRPLPTLTDYDTDVHDAWIRYAGRGNIELVLDVSGELAAIRRRKRTTIAPRGPNDPAAYDLYYKGTQRLPAVPLGRPFPSPGEAPTLQGESLSVQLRQARAHLPLAPAVAIPQMPAVPLTARPVEQPSQSFRDTVRRGIRTFLIPMEAREALRRYLARLQQSPSKYTQANIVLGAAYALYTSKLGAIPFGVRVTPKPGGGFEFTPARELATQGIRAESLIPGEIEREFGTDLPYGAQTPVFYETTLSLVFSVLGGYRLYNTHFSNILKDQFRWTVEGRLPGSKIEFLKPPRQPPRGPPANYTFGEAPTLRPFPQHRYAQQHSPDRRGQRTLGS